MEKPIFDQLICALVSAGGGIGFGVVYDFFKALRLKAKNAVFAAATDIIVCATGFAMLFFLFMSLGGGEARIYIALCAVAGALIYFVTASGALLDFFTGIINLISKFLQLLIKPIKYLCEKLKNQTKKVKMFFQNACKRFTIMVQGRKGGSQKKQDVKKEHGHEAQTRRHSDKNRHSRARSVRGDKPILTEAADGGRSRKAK